MEQSYNKSLILGLGNDILSDDAIGIIVVRRLGEMLKGNPNLDFKETSEMGLALLDYIEGYRKLIIVDAIIGDTDDTVGTVKNLSMEDFSGAGCTTPHFLGIKDTIELGKKMGMSMPEEVLLLGIEVKDPFSVSEKLSDRLNEKLENIIEEVRRRVEKFSEVTLHG